MRNIKLTIPEMAMVVGTRVALGIGIGLLIGQRLTRSQREAAGVALVAFGVLTTIPIVIGIASQRSVAGSHPAVTTGSWN